MARVVRSFAKHVTHQDAVIFKNTGRPDARAVSNAATSKRFSAVSPRVGSSSTLVTPQTTATTRASPALHTRLIRALLFMPSQLSKPSPTLPASSTKTASAPACRANTQVNHTAVKNIGNAMACFIVTIHAPGFGNRRAIVGKPVINTYGAAIPIPRTTITRSNAPVPRLKPYPIADAMNGTVHGVATTTAIIPVRKAFGLLMATPKPGNSSTPSKFKPIAKNKTVIAETNPGSCN